MYFLLLWYNTTENKELTLLLSSRRDTVHHGQEVMTVKKLTDHISSEHRKQKTGSEVSWQ